MLSDKPWKLEGTIMLLLGIFVCWSFVSLAVLAAQGLVSKGGALDGSAVNLILGTMGLPVSVLLATGLFLHFQKTTWSEAFGFSRGTAARVLVLGLFAALAFYPIGNLLQGWSRDLLLHYQPKIDDQQAVTALQNAAGWGRRSYLIVIAVLVAPATEEILFRGIFYVALRQAGFPRLALWTSSIVFAGIHFSSQVFLPLLAFGLLLAVLYEKTGNLLSSIATHGVFNGINVLILYFGPGAATH